MRLGLSLSGGGFRATLFHLGVVRFLRDAGLLREVSDIVSVSGGSILAAHLALNWDRYNSTEKDFDDAAGEILRFVALDIRNGMVRRIPFQLPLRWLNALMRRGFNRALTVNGLMEGYLNRHLYHDRCVHELPANPRVRILATNVSEGGLCSFQRDGVYMQRRSAGSPDWVTSVPAQLTPIAMAVAASAAFPGFFPPVQIRAADVGAQEGQFPTQTLTDGGVYDNLGVRTFYWIRKVAMDRNQTVNPGELDPRAVVALARVEESSPQAIRWLARQLPEATLAALAQSHGAPPAELVSEVAGSLSNLLKRQSLSAKPEFGPVAPDDPTAAALLARARGGEQLEPRWQVWLDRHLLASALKQAVGGDVLPPIQPLIDEILVSDAGQPFAFLSQPNLGFLAQSMRATDIMWDRIWQLEQANFGSDPSFRFIQIHHRVPREQDPTALHPVIQVEVPMIRTDLDRFSPLECRTLVTHGYEVARSVCSHRVADSNVRDLPPWNPFAEPDAAPAVKPSGSRETADARSLRRSAGRRVWSTLLDWRDWPTYVYVPLLILLFVVLPIYGWRFYQRSRQHNTVVNAIAHGMPDFKKAMQLIDSDPQHGWKADPVEQVDALGKVDHQGWELVNDTRILDLRNYEPSGWSRRKPSYYYCNSLRVRKLPSYQGDGRLTLVYPIRGPAPEVRVKSPELRPVVKQLGGTEVAGQPGTLAHIELDLSHLPHGDSIDLELEFLFRDVSDVKGYWVRYKPMMPTKMSNVWLLFPKSHPYRDYTLRSFVAGQPGTLEKEEPRYLIDHPHGLVIAWSLTNPREERTYECQWTWE